MIEPGDVAALLLAAGQSERFGTEDKLLASLDGMPLALHAAERLAALNFGWRIAICRDGSPLIDSLMALGFNVKINPDPARGLSSSLALGIEQAELVGAEAALVALGDMPFITPRHLSALMAGFDAKISPIVASSDHGTGMSPALFGKAFFEHLRTASGDQGGRALFSQATLISAEPAELRDIDRPEDIG